MGAFKANIHYCIVKPEKNNDVTRGVFRMLSNIYDKGFVLR